MSNDQVNVPENNDEDSTVKKQIVLTLNIYETGEVAAAMHTTMMLLNAETENAPDDIKRMVNNTTTTLERILECMVARENYTSAEFHTEEETRVMALAEMAPILDDLEEAVPEEIAADIQAYKNQRLN